MIGEALGEQFHKNLFDEGLFWQNHRAHINDFLSRILPLKRLLFSSCSGECDATDTHPHTSGICCL